MLSILFNKWIYQNLILYWNIWSHDFMCHLSNLRRICDGNSSINVHMYLHQIMLVWSLKNKFSPLVLAHYTWKYKDDLIRILIGLGIKWFWCCLLSCINCEQMQAMLIILKISYWHIYNTSTVTCTSRLDTVALTLIFFNVFVKWLGFGNF